MAVNRDDARKAELGKLLATKNGDPRSAVSGNADAFGEYSLTDFIQEMSILEAAGAAWGRKFCQASVGSHRRGGGSYVSYDGHTPKSVVHPEVFLGKSNQLTHVNFWAEYLHRGAAVASTYDLPFAILAQFEDGLFTSKVDALPSPTVGTRLGKGLQYQGFENLVITFPMTMFKQVSRKS